MCNKREKIFIFLEEESSLQEDWFDQGNAMIGHVGLSDYTEHD